MADYSSFSQLLAAANRGDGVAMFWLAERHANGDDVAVNLGMAMKWYEKAARAGVQDAMLELARIYLRDIGVPIDLEKCKYWLERAYSTDHLICLVPKAKERHGGMTMQQLFQKKK